ncbi:bacteriohemerythrin [Candidatus Magnetaquicoccus inordinatus]|uniref:bacteriohemerythrin n=1 Tax=Candidatus Magnetaquicoccus inordinatus TaxID=2496818 RepID=UPI00187D2A18|nr:hemerythrin family protein [Candidatus Magnetaquicoccus inordinatus]
MRSEFHTKLLDKLVDVGEPAFNMAHEKLLDMVINADVILGSAVSENRSLSTEEWNNLANIFDELISYAKIHFSEEMDHLRAHGYPNVEQHQVDHDALVDELNHFQRKVMENDDANVRDIRKWLLAWLLNHVNYKDLEYAQYFASKKAPS